MSGYPGADAAAPESYQQGAPLPMMPPQQSQQPHQQAQPHAYYPAAAAYPGAYPAVANAAVPPAAPPSFAPSPVVLLPAGAVAHNGGVLFPANQFANSYRVPGPGGRDWVHYDASVPLPPAAQRPTLLEQWHQHTWWLKAFWILLVGWYAMQWIGPWHVALCLPLLFVATYLLYRLWSRHYWSTVELYLLSKLYALAFVPGAIVVMIIESVITVFFMFICFQSQLKEYFEHAAKNGGAASPEPAATEPSNGSEAPPGMEFLNFRQTPALFIFLFLLSYVSAGCVEEGLKYWLLRRVHKYRPAYAHVRGMLMYAMAGALGFSTMENIGYVFSGAVSKGGDSSFLGVLFNTLGRACISTPLHVMTAYLLGLQVVRRDVLGERLSLPHVMGWSVFFHGTFDYLLFLIMALSNHWSSGPDDQTVSVLLSALVVLNVYAGLAWKIWRIRRKVFAQMQEAEPQVEHAVDVENSAHDADAAAAPGHALGAVHPNGFQRLQQSEHAADAMQAV